MLMSVKRDELIKYITGRIVEYMETPKSRAAAGEEARLKESWQYRWFGLLPVTLHIWRSRMRRKSGRRR